MVDPVTLTLLVISCEGVRDGSEALAALRKESRASAYEAPSTAELEGAARLFAELLSDAPDLPRARTLAAAVGLEVIELRAGDDRIAIVRENACARRGRGFFAFRLARSRALLIEAPHAFTDRYTGPIAEQLFLESGAAAAAWNTSSRSAPPGVTEGREKRREEKRHHGGPGGDTEGDTEKRGEGEEGRGVGREPGEDGFAPEAAAADLARLPESFLQELTRAFARARPEGIVLQLHGFDEDARGARSAHAILSNATRDPPPWVAAIAACLGEAISRKADLYPRDSSELGGTRNAQGKLLRTLGSLSFLHLELSLEVRVELSKDPALRKKLLLCLPERVP